MTYLYIGNWKEKGLKYLPSAFKQTNNTSLQPYIDIFTEHLQEIEDDKINILIQNNPMTATGVHLERFNNLLEIPKDPLWNDEVNRMMILAKAIANRSTGTRKDKYSILNIVGYNKKLVNDYYPATSLVQVNESDSPSITPNLLLNFMRSCSLQINLEVSLAPDEPFGFDDDATALGFGLGGLSEKGAEPYQNKLATPSNLAYTDVTFGEITITWDSVDYATSYLVRVYNVDLEILEFFENVGNVTTYTITGLNPITEYDIQVKAIG